MYQHGTEENDYGLEVVTDDDGNVFVAGNSKGNMETRVNLGETDIFLARYPVKGEFCIRGRPCAVQVYDGQGLQDGDRLMVLKVRLALVF